MHKKTKQILIGAGIALVVIIALYLFYINGPETSVTGTSTIKVEPDLISIYVNIEARHLNAQTAENAVSIISDELLAELKTFGLEDKDIQLSNYGVYPEYNWNSGAQVLKDYLVSQQLIIKVVSFGKISYLIDAIAKTDAMVSGINYELSSAKQNEYKAQALNEATMDAKTKANSLALGAGRRIGKLVSIQSQEFNYNPYPLYTRDAAVSGNAAAQKAVSTLSLSPKELEVSAVVSATYTMTRF